MSKDAKSREPVFALVAHDNMKSAIVEWALAHIAVLKQAQLVATQTTGGLISKELGPDSKLAG